MLTRNRTEIIFITVFLFLPLVGADPDNDTTLKPKMSRADKLRAMTEWLKAREEKNEETNQQLMERNREMAMGLATSRTDRKKPSLRKAGWKTDLSRLLNRKLELELQSSKDPKIRRKEARPEKEEEIPVTVKPTPRSTATGTTERPSFVQQSEKDDVLENLKFENTQQGDKPLTELRECGEDDFEYEFVWVDNPDEIEKIKNDPDVIDVVQVDQRPVAKQESIPMDSGDEYEEYDEYADEFKQSKS